MPLILPTLPPRITQALGLAREFWRWWLDELIAMVPERVLSLLQDQGERVVARLESGGLVVLDGDGTKVPRPSSGITRAILLLPPSLVLRRVLELPIIAGPDLAAAISFEIDRQTPFQAESVQHRFRVLGSSATAKRLRVELAVVPQGIIEQALVLAGAAGLTADAIRLEGDRTAPQFDFMPADRRPSSSWRSEPWKPLAVAALLALLLGPSAIAAWTAREAAALDAELATKRDAGRRNEALRAELDSLLAAERFLPERQALPKAITTLETLSKTVPSDSWIYLYDWTPKEVQLQGIGAHVPSLIEALESQKSLDAPTLRAPVQQGKPGEGDRFDLALGLKGTHAP
jgi:general secretion pathway protein L